MSKRIPAVSVLTANRLHDGLVVFLAADGAWVESIAGAAVAGTPEEAQALQAQGTRASAHNLVVDPYLAEVREIGGRLRPVRQRERVRVDGPSILGDVPGYVVPPPSPHATSAWGEGRGEGQPRALTTAIATALHPDPLPASGEREHGAEAA
jgi:hypothetical protein